MIFALLKELSEHNEVGVTLTVTTMDRELARLTEPYAPAPALRMEAVAKLNAAGVPAGVIANPVLPLLTDSEENLESVAKAAKLAGAREFGANVLFLMPAAQRVFFPFLAEKFPEHLRRYEANYSAGAYLKGAYPDRIRALVNGIRGTSSAFRVAVLSISAHQSLPAPRCYSSKRMNISLSQKAAVVTGAARGIGRAIAEKLASAGASVLLVDIDESAFRNAKTAIESPGGKVSILAGDLTAPEFPERDYREADSGFWIGRYRGQQRRLHLGQRDSENHR